MRRGGHGSFYSRRVAGLELSGCSQIWRFRYANCTAPTDRRACDWPGTVHERALLYHAPGRCWSRSDQNRDAWPRGSSPVYPTLRHGRTRAPSGWGLYRLQPQQEESGPQPARGGRAPGLEGPGKHLGRGRRKPAPGRNGQAGTWLRATQDSQPWADLCCHLWLWAPGELYGSLQ